MSRRALTALAVGLALVGASPGGAEPRDRASAIAAGGGRSFASYGHTCAIVDDGVQCWGAAQDWQVGSRLFDLQAPLPHRVPGLAAPVRALAAGSSHSCALAGGRALCWGINSWRQLGNETDFALATPRVVPGLPEPVTGIAAGSLHTCAIAEGGVWCWGRDDSGELGSRERVATCGFYQRLPCRASPVRVPGLDGVTAVAAGEAHTCAIAAGSVHCWGANDRGQLGRGSGAGGPEPAPVPSVTGASALAAGARHTCALVAGKLLCWGANERGQLGDGTTADRSQPVPVPGLSGVTALATGARHTCAAAADGVHCWGTNEEGQLGLAASAEPRSEPARVSGLGADVTGLAAGIDHTCALLGKGRVRCWGDDDFGQLGDGVGRAASRGPLEVAAWDDGRIRDHDGDGRIAIVCVGDSNTYRDEGAPATWCDRLPELLGPEHWSSTGRGMPGATATPGLTPIDAMQQLAYALENDAPDVVILAFGTNDVARGVEADAVVAAYEGLARRVHSRGALAFVALTPPTKPVSHERNDRIRALNAKLREAFGDERVIDFHGALGPDDLADKAHLNAAGHAKAARAAAEALRARAPRALAPAP